MSILGVSGEEGDDDDENNDINPYSTPRPTSRNDPRYDDSWDNRREQPATRSPDFGHDTRVFPNHPLRNSPFRVHLGERVVLRCKSDDPYSRQTEWRRPDGRALPSNARLDGDDLIIDRAQTETAGNYECVTFDENNRPIVVVVADIIVIASPPSITFSPEMPISVRPGEHVEIYCNATGEQPLTVSWHGEYGHLPK